MPPQGFDLAAYVHRHGTAHGIHIGRNGRSINDNYFREYLSQCEAEIDSKEKSCSDLVGSDSKGIDELTELKQESVPNKRRQVSSIPLCWEDQLSKADVGCTIIITIHNYMLH